MQRLDVPPSTSLPFPELIGRIADYLLPFAAMWRSYWLQAVAVRGSETWLLCHLALIGQWSQFPHAERFCDYIPGGSLIAVSQSIDEDSFRQILTSLRTTGTISLPHDITTMTPSSPASSGWLYWQEPYGTLPYTIADFAETAIWRDLHVNGSMGWHPTSNQQEKLQVESRLRDALRADLERRSERDFGTFLSNKFAARERNPNTLYLDNFYYYLDFPLALAVEAGPGDQASNTCPLIVKCRPPLTLEALRLTTGRTWTSDAPLMPIEPLPPTDDGWSAGKVTVPYLCHRVWLTYEEMLARSLVYDLTVPTPEAQARDVIGYIYNYGSPDKGLEGWSHDLVESDGAKFELALLNALTRLGVPALFAGQLEGGGKTKSQPTPGFDLVALDHAHRRAAAISAKGTSNSPGYKEVQSLIEGVAMLGRRLPGWHVDGIIACHAPTSRLGHFAGRTDVRVWGLEHVAFLLYADRHGQIAPMLWTAPGTTLPHAYWG